jgi:hypothetical protein
VPDKLNAARPPNKDHSGVPEQPEQNPSAQKPKLPTSLDSQTAVGGPIEFQYCAESDIQKAIQWFAEYLRAEREEYHAIAGPLAGEWRDMMEGYFEPVLLDRVRVLELVDERVANPWFYPKAREKGFQHLPDITHKAAVTFLDVVVFNERMGSRDLFHGLVHAAQLDVLGVAEFTELFVRGFLRARSYFLAPMKAHAFALDARFAANPGVRFCVEDEIRDWWRAGRYGSASFPFIDAT